VPSVCVVVWVWGCVCVCVCTYTCAGGEGGVNLNPVTNQDAI